LTKAGASTITPLPSASFWPKTVRAFRAAAKLERFNEAAMPKMKTNKAASKRFKITGSGRVKRSKAGGNHGMQEKSRKRVRRLRNNDMVHKTMEKHVKKLLPYG
jgi:large subunit ribosomal protein L35